MRGMPLQSSPSIRFLGQGPVWLRFLGIALLLTAGAWAGHGLWQAWQQQLQINDQQASIARVEAALAAPASRPPTKVSTRTLRDNSSLLDSAAWPPEQRGQVNGVIRQLNTPWHDLFKQLESSTPKDVALISVEPDARRGSLRLQAEAKTLDSLLVYADRLQNQGVLGQLTYSKHETNDQDPNQPIRLSVEYTLQAPPRLQNSVKPRGGSKP
jgi:Tfp pilus assembly protein PilN